MDYWLKYAQKGNQKDKNNFLNKIQKEKAKKMKKKPNKKGIKEKTKKIMVSALIDILCPKRS